MAVQFAASRSALFARPFTARLKRAENLQCANIPPVSNCPSGRIFCKMHILRPLFVASVPVSVQNGGRCRERMPDVPRTRRRIDPFDGAVEKSLARSPQGSRRGGTWKAIEPASRTLKRDREGRACRDRGCSDGGESRRASTFLAESETLKSIETRLRRTLKRGCAILARGKHEERGRGKDSSRKVLNVSEGQQKSHAEALRGREKMTEREELKRCVFP